MKQACALLALGLFVGVGHAQVAPTPADVAAYLRPLVATP